MKIRDLPASEATRLIPLLQDLHALHVDHHPERYRASPTDAELSSWLEAWLREKSITALIAESPQGALLGYTLFEIETRPALPVKLAETRLIVHHIAVSQAFRRMGVGLALLNEVKRQASIQAITTIATTYAPFNTASARLFQSIGLKPVMTMAEWRA
ncbi:GNAT family N-acetyltransferase [Pseudophaeobacter sp.]|uniref:GNAT family N-acetyltransferase n=1 Tax=Pseudophaeobacter sp. TaxID=1971739 RepID=UPI003299415A